MSFNIHGGWNRLIEVNISNALDPINCVAGVDTVLPLTNNGANPFNSRNQLPGRLSFDPTFNSNNGGIIIDRVHNDSHFECRFTFTNEGTANTTAVFKVFLVFNKNDPLTGITIVSSPLSIKTDKEQTIPLSFFGGGIQAIYPICNAEGTTDIRLNGFLVSAWENR